MDRTVRTPFVVALLAAWCAGCGGKAAPKPAPDFTVERAIAPIEKVKLSSLKGKVVLIDFWATWCAPCKATMPAIDRMYKQYKDKGFEVMAISNEKRAEVREFLKGLDYSYPFYVDVSLEGYAAYSVEGIPRTILVDRAGMVVYDETGLSSEKELEAAIEAAL